MDNNTKALKVKAQIFKLLMDISNFYPQYSMTQHLVHICRSKGQEKKAYEWTDEELLKKIENYYDELNAESSNDTDA